MAETIPTEIVERILTFAAAADRPTTAVVCLTNKMRRGVATPALYYTVGITKGETKLALGLQEGDDNFGFGDEESAEHGTRKLALLYRALLENRKLTRQVTNIKQYLWGGGGGFANATFDLDCEVARSIVDEAAMSVSPRRLLADMVDPADADNPDLAWGEDGEYQEGVFIALMLLASPQVKTL